MFGNPKNTTKLALSYLVENYNESLLYALHDTKRTYALAASKWH